jgi:hypothetical protein
MTSTRRGRCSPTLIAKLKCQRTQPVQLLLRQKTNGERA